MIVSLIALIIAATSAGQAPDARSAAVAEPTPASARLTEAAARAGLSDLPDLTVLGYEVEGRSPRAIRSSINDRRPPAQDGGARHDARTHWNYATRWRGGSDGRCDPRTATVALTLNVVLPDLATRDRLSTREKADWDRYFAALVAHERNHGRIALEGRDRMQAAMRAGASCDAMRAAVQAISAEVSAASRTYDAQTDHGRREGAVYPTAGS